MAENIVIQIPASGAPSGVAVVAAGGNVRFNNNAGKDVHIDFGNRSPFCPQTMNYNLKAAKSKSLDVCANIGIQGTYTYASTVKGRETQTATLSVTSLVPTNPYVFPEKKPYVFPEGGGVPMLAGLALGAVIGVLVGRHLLARNPRQT